MHYQQRQHTSLGSLFCHLLGHLQHQGDDVHGAPPGPPAHCTTHLARGMGRQQLGSTPQPGTRVLGQDPPDDGDPLTLYGAFSEGNGASTAGTRVLGQDVQVCQGYYNLCQVQNQSQGQGQDSCPHQ